MEILFLCSWYPTPENPNFGIFIKEHAVSVRLAGHRVTAFSVICKKSNDLCSLTKHDYVDENDIHVIQIIISSRYRDFFHHLLPYHYIILLQALKPLIKSGYSPDLIHTNVVFSAGILGNWLSHKLKIPYIITEHWSRVPRLLKQPVLSSWGIKAYQSSAKILPVSGFLQNRLCELIPELDKNKFTVVGNIVDTKTFRYKPKNRTKGVIRFCAIATWNKKKIPDKKPELFIEALGKLKKEIEEEISLTIIGGGDNLLYLKSLCASNEINVKCTGYIPKSEIAEELYLCDYFLHASTIETFSIVVAEALLTGTPVLCSNVGALPELVNQSNGVLCNNTADEWIDGMKCIINTLYDAEEISNGISNRFSPENIGRKISDIYAQI